MVVDVMALAVAVVAVAVVAVVVVVPSEMEILVAVLAVVVVVDVPETVVAEAIGLPMSIPRSAIAATTSSTNRLPDNDDNVLVLFRTSKLFQYASEHFRSR
jgi:hypothetical protein